MSASFLVWAGLGGYIVALLAIGAAASRKTHDATDYIVAGHRLPGWICTFTLFATWFGSALCVGAAGRAYDAGLLGVIEEPFGGALCLLLSGVFIFGLVRRLRFLTLCELYRARFGAHAEILTGLTFVLIYVVWVSGMFAGFGVVLQVLTGVDTSTAIVIAALVVVVYTTSGGMWAVSITDVVQSVILIVGIVYLLPVVVEHAGGPSVLLSSLPAGHLDFFPDASLSASVGYFHAWIVIGLGAIPDQALFQRASGARDAKTARASAVVAAAMYLVMGLVIVAIGMAGRIIFPALENSELVLPRLSLQFFPPVAVAVFAGALFSAFMSSADSALLAPASIISVNLLKYVKPRADTLRATRVSVVVLTIIAAAIALYFRRVYDAIIFTGSLGLVVLFVPMLAALFWKKANRTAALVSMYAGLASWALHSWIQSDYPADLLAFLTSAVVLYVVARLTAESDPPVPLVDSSGAVVD